jgi:hypothetical protein
MVRSSIKRKSIFALVTNRLDVRESISADMGLLWCGLFFPSQGIPVFCPDLTSTTLLLVECAYGQLSNAFTLPDANSTAEIDVLIFCVATADGNCPLSVLRVTRSGEGEGVLSLTHRASYGATKQKAAVQQLIYHARSLDWEVKLAEDPVMDSDWLREPISSIPQCIASLLAVLPFMLPSLGTERAERSPQAIYESILHTRQRILAGLSGGVTSHGSGHQVREPAVGETLVNAVALCERVIRARCGIPSAEESKSRPLIEDLQREVRDSRRQLVFFDPAECEDSVSIRLRQFRPADAVARHHMSQYAQRVLHGMPALKYVADLLLSELATGPGTSESSFEVCTCRHPLGLRRCKEIHSSLCVLSGRLRGIRSVKGSSALCEDMCRDCLAS